MAITDQTILSEIQRVTLEGAGDGGATWPSGMWTQAEILGYLNQRQNRLLAAIGLLWKVDETAIVTGQADQDAPADWIASLFIAYKSAAGVYTELPKLSQYELDLVVPSWPLSTSATPRGYYEAEGNETLTTFVVPIPTAVGSALERYYVFLGTALTALGVNFTVPDEFVATVKYGCLADMFGKVGQAQNLELAQACEGRWEEGMQLGMLMSKEGWFAL
jgi:hypothetical protein